MCLTIPLDVLWLDMQCNKYTNILRIDLIAEKWNKRIHNETLFLLEIVRRGRKPFPWVNHPTHSIS